MEMSPELQVALSVLLQALLAAALALITFGVQKIAAFFIAKRDEVRANIGEVKFDLLVSQVELIVKAAEQLGIKGAIENEGAVKLKWAIEQIQRAADTIGIEVNVDEVRVLVEAAIRDGLQKGTGEG